MKVSWRAYFKDFWQTHGGDPVAWRANPEVDKSGRLLFPDGWSYSARNVEGPEYPPPEDEQKHLMLIKLYWHKRRAVLQEHYEQMRQTISELAEAQQKLSAALQIPSATLVEDDEGVAHRRVALMDIDFDSMIEDLKVIKDDIVHCTQMMNNPTIPESAFVSRTVKVDVQRALELLDYGARDDQLRKARGATREVL